MTRLLILLCPVILLAGCSTNPEKRVPRAAADAMTGSPWTLTAVASLTMEGSGTMREIQPGASIHDSSQFTVTSFKRVLNFRTRQWRGDMTVVSDSRPSTPVRFSMGLVGERFFRRDVEREQTWNSILGPEQVSQVLRHPVGFLQAAFSGSLPLSGTRSAEGLDAVDLTISGRVYTLFVDQGTKLPTKIVTTYHTAPSDVIIETAFPSYKTMHGYKLPSRIVTKVGPTVAEDLKIDQQVASADAVELTLPDKL